MTIDLRASALNVTGYPGNAHTLRLTWPAGVLVGTTWTATIDGDPVDSVTVDGDVLEIELTIPEGVGGYELLLIQTDVTPDAVKAAGRVRSTETAQTDLDSTELTVTLSTAEGLVTVLGTGPSGAVGADGVSDGDKGEIVVSGSGTVWTIEPGVVTPAKLSFDPATQAELDAEVTARLAGDSALDGRLDTIEALGPLATDAELAAEAALARNADNLTSGTVADARIPASIARDAEVAAGYQPLDADLTALAAANNSAVLAATTASFLLADETKLDGIEAGATADQTAAELLTAIKTVDGTGSGLDADLLDGLNSSAFAEADGEYAVNTVAASGATETLTLAPAHRVTMDQSCTFTFPTPTAGHTFTLLLSGAFTPTFPASVRWNSGTAPTYATASKYVFETVDGGTRWVGTLVASGFTL